VANESRPDFRYSDLESTSGPPKSYTLAARRWGSPQTAAKADDSYDERTCRMGIAFAVAIGGGLGSLSRYEVDTWIERRSESLFPWATFLINVTGCFAVGFLIAAVVDRHSAPQWLRTGLVVGFCGGYTTFSTFAQESLDLIEARNVAIAAAYVVASIIIGIVGVAMGTTVGRLV
jgi:fluoride exporter